VRFEDFQLLEPILRAVAEEGYTAPTPIQEQAIPHVMAGRDLVGCAQTGTGKTAAFALPILHRLSGTRGRGGVRVLVLSPTRELASQIEDCFASYGRHLPFRRAVIFGGVGQSAQESALRRGVDVLVATPGRLLDLMGQGHLSLRDVEIFVLDEADRMLDMGFIHDVKRVVAALPKARQTLLFSATMPEDIRRLSASILIDPVSVAVAPVSSTAERIEQQVFFVEKGDKRALLEHLLRDRGVTRALVFTRTKHGANRVAEGLEKAGVVAKAIHGNKSQNARERALDGFRDGSVRVLVATDIAARGIDVEGVSHVINFELPNVPETYVHRIGRTARAAASGIALSFCEAEERPFLADIQRLIRLGVPVVAEHPFRSSIAPPPPFDPEARRAPLSGPRPAPQPGGQGQGARGGRPGFSGGGRNNPPRTGAPPRGGRGGGGGGGGGAGGGGGRSGGGGGGPRSPR